MFSLTPWLSPLERGFSIKNFTACYKQSIPYALRFFNAQEQTFVSVNAGVKPAVPDYASIRPSRLW